MAVFVIQPLQGFKFRRGDLAAHEPAERRPSSCCRLLAFSLLHSFIPRGRRWDARSAANLPEVFSHTR